MFKKYYLHKQKILAISIVDTNIGKQVYSLLVLLIKYIIKKMY